MSQQSVMQVNQQETNFSIVLNKEYLEAVNNGFKGTFDDYCVYRDYIKAQ